MSVLADYDRIAQDIDRLPTRRNANAQLGAVKAKLQLLKDRTAFLISTGLIPKDLTVLDYHRDAVELAEAILEVFDEHDVPVEIQRAVVEAVEARQGRAARSVASSAEAELPLRGSGHSA